MMRLRHWQVSGLHLNSTVLVDVNGDGILDFPSAGMLSPWTGSLRPSSALFIRVFGRNGAANQFGASVCATTLSGRESDPLGCRVIDTGASGSQSSYDVHFGQSAVAMFPYYRVSVAFTNGHVHSPETAAAYLASTWPRYPSVPWIVVVRDVPSIASVVSCSWYSMMSVVVKVLVMVTRIMMMLIMLVMMGGNGVFLGLLCLLSVLVGMTSLCMFLHGESADSNVSPALSTCAHV